MARIDTIVVGASAGGVEALSRLVALLPADFPAAVLVVLHIPQGATSVLPAILSRNGPLSAAHARDGEPLEPGRVYCAPPGQHLLLHDDHLVLVNGPKENGNRPAIDPLFRTAAHARRNRVVGVLLSGLLDDGTMGCWAVRRQGGVTICQDPEDALFGDMPRHAIEAGAASQVLALDAIGPALARLAGQDAPDLPSDEEAMPDPIETSLDGLNRLETRGQPSSFVCPRVPGHPVRVGGGGRHALPLPGRPQLPSRSRSPSSQRETMEAALWTALRALQEHNDLLGKHAPERRASRVRGHRQGVPKQAGGGKAPDRRSCAVPSVSPMLHSAGRRRRNPSIPRSEPPEGRRFALAEASHWRGE